MKTRRLRRYWYGAAYALVFLLIACCAPGLRSGSTAELRARTSLDVLADVVDPAYQMAMQGCVDRENYAMMLGEKGLATVDATESNLAIISKRCNTVRVAFESIREYHDQAVAFVEDGKFDDALDRIDAMQAAWRELRGKVTDENS